MDDILDKLDAGSITLIDEEGRLGKSWSNVTRHIDSAEVRDVLIEKILHKVWSLKLTLNLV